MILTRMNLTKHQSPNARRQKITLMMTTKKLKTSLTMVNPKKWKKTLMMNEPPLLLCVKVLYYKP